MRHESWLLIIFNMTVMEIIIKRKFHYFQGFFYIFYICYGFDNAVVLSFFEKADHTTINIPIFF